MGLVRCFTTSLRGLENFYRALVAYRNVFLGLLYLSLMYTNKKTFILYFVGFDERYLLQVHFPLYEINCSSSAKEAFGVKVLVQL